MTRDQQLKTLKSPKASKEQLRQALAASLGVEYEAKWKESVKTLTNQCRETFLEAYNKHTGLNYSFNVKDGVALAGIIRKISSVNNTTDDCIILDSFNALIYYLPDWYKQNAFSLTVINNKFNEIVASIRKNGGKKTRITDDYKARVLNDLTT